MSEDADALALLREDIAGLREAVEEVRSLLTQRSGTQAELLTVAEAAALARVTSRTIHDWISKRRLTRYRAGRHVRVKRAELIALLTAPDGEIDNVASIADRIVRSV